MNTFFFSFVLTSRRRGDVSSIDALRSKLLSLPQTALRRLLLHLLTQDPSLLAFIDLEKNPRSKSLDEMAVRTEGR